MPRRPNPSQRTPRRPPQPPPNRRHARPNRPRSVVPKLRERATAPEAPVDTTVVGVAEAPQEPVPLPVLIPLDGRSPRTDTCPFFRAIDARRDPRSAIRVRRSVQPLRGIRRAATTVDQAAGARLPPGCPRQLPALPPWRAGRAVPDRSQGPGPDEARASTGDGAGGGDPRRLGRGLGRIRRRSRRDRPADRSRRHLIAIAGCDRDSRRRRFAVAFALARPVAPSPSAGPVAVPEPNSDTELVTDAASDAEGYAEADPDEYPIPSARSLSGPAQLLDLHGPIGRQHLQHRQLLRPLGADPLQLEPGPRGHGPEGGSPDPDAAAHALERGPAPVPAASPSTSSERAPLHAALLRPGAG